MSLGQVLHYCIRAAAFAALVCGVWTLICWIGGRRLRLWTLAKLGYFSALIEITVIRGGINFEAMALGKRALPQLVPLRTTLAQLRAGWWPLMFHAVGNLIWFLPLGVYCRRKPWWLALALGAALSMGIELMQYALASGTTDVDDVLINALGALLGWGLGRWMLGRGRQAQN